MTITIDRNGMGWLLFGFFMGVYLTGTAWWASEQYRKDALREMLLAKSECDPEGSGIVTVHYPEGGEYNCTPTRYLVQPQPKTRIKARIKTKLEPVELKETTNG